MTTEPARHRLALDLPDRPGLLAEVAAGRWRKEPPGPALPPDVLAETRRKYEEAARMLA